MNIQIYEIFQSEKLKNISLHSSGVLRSTVKDDYVVWQIISDVPNSRMDLSFLTSIVRVQFDVYSEQERRVFEISDDLINEIICSGKGQLLLSSGPFFNADTRKYRRSIDISFFKER